MSKSILVIDTPKCCEECPLELDINGKVGANICRGCEKYSYNPDSKKKPDWCPLKNIPQKANHPDYCDNGRYEKGWNDCIDEILKECD